MEEFMTFSKNVIQICLITASMSLVGQVDAMNKVKGFANSFSAPQPKIGLWQRVKDWAHKPSTQKMAKIGGGLALIGTGLGWFAFSGFMGISGSLWSILYSCTAPTIGDALAVNIPTGLLACRGAKKIKTGLNMPPRTSCSLDSMSALPWNGAKGVARGIGRVIEYKSKTQWNPHYDGYEI
jgi:hypothetical protein